MLSFPITVLSPALDATVQDGDADDNDDKDETGDDENDDDLDAEVEGVILGDGSTVQLLHLKKTGHSLSRALEETDTLSFCHIFNPFYSLVGSNIAQRPLLPSSSTRIAAEKE